jgi:hypothetical protein
VKLIGINGFKTSGKDTAFKLIRNYVEGSAPRDPSYRVERRAFADNLKIAGALALGFERSDDELIALMDSFKEGAGITMLYNEPGTPVTPNEDLAIMHFLSGREYLQNFGNHARNVFGENFWIDQVLPEARVEYEKIWRTQGRRGPIDGMPAVGCITDVRYPNEAERVLSMGGTVLEIVRSECQSDGHASEKPLARDLVSATINNDGDLVDFSHGLRDLVDSL